MANSYQIIDEKTWQRAMHCAVFRNSVEPAFCVTFTADITNFKRMVKEEGLSFTMSMVYAMCKWHRSVSLPFCRWTGFNSGFCAGTSFFCRWPAYRAVCGRIAKVLE